MAYTPSKKEIKVLQYLHGVESRYDGRKGEKRATIKADLNLSEGDIGDLQGSDFLHFTNKIIQHPTEHVNEIIICITNQGNTFVENYCYYKTKEFFYWIFGLSSIVAAVFAVWAVFLKNN